MKKEMLINVLQPEECRIAIVEDGILEELYVERSSHENYTGNIYKGRVVNIEPAVNAAFVDFSVGRNGFLHVSDVEPQYYRRLLPEEPIPAERDRVRHPREESLPGAMFPARTPREEAKPLVELEAPAHPSTPPPPPVEDLVVESELPWEPEGGWPDESDRPDRSEKPKRDRPERRFGEGLIEGWDEPPSRPKRGAPPSPTPAARSEATKPKTEALAENFKQSARPVRREDRETVREGEVPIGWRNDPQPGGTLPQPIEADLPPSRTARPARARELGAEAAESRPSTPTDEPESWLRGRVPEQAPTSPDHSQPPSRQPAPPTTPERARLPITPSPRSRETKPEIEPLPTALPEGQLPESFVQFEAELEQIEDLPRRRGRDAIRARGGDRPTGRPRDRQRARPPEDRPTGPTPPPYHPDAGTTLPPRRGRKPQDRAGEPGYVPRRERTRPPEASPSSAIEPVLGRDDAEILERPIERGLPIDEQQPRRRVSSDRYPGMEEGPRRRRRRRRRPGEPDSTRATEGAPQGDDLADLLGPEEPPRPRRAHVAREPLIEDFESIESHGSEVEEFGAEEGVGLLESDRFDDEIDPELAEEIRREIEEIQELECEMGLRATTEARPRRADEPAAVVRGERPRPRGHFKPPIQDIFKRGDEVLVQVIKESIGTKGPTLSTYISIPGRYLVLMPGLNRVGVSRKIADEGQRRRLREIMHALNPPKGLGFIVRTAGLDRAKRELARDLAYLLRLWKVILKRIKKAKAPAPIYQESDMIIRTIRDIFTGEIDTIWIDERNAYERAHEFMKVVMPKFVDRIKFYDEKVPLFHKYGLEEEIARIQRRRVDLAGGGSIVIDPTEALVAIDVNSGNFRVEDDAERTAYEMNLRAAKEIARQLRLRDLGGVIVNDFIDMREERHRRGVERALREAVRRDRARTKVLRMSQFGIIEMTRQRIRPSLKRSVYEDCPHCAGAGVAKTAESMAIDVMRLLALASHRAEVRRVNISVAGPVATYLSNRKRREIAQIENDSNILVHIRHQIDAPAEHLQVECSDSLNNEIRLFPAAVPPPRRGR